MLASPRAVAYVGIDLLGRILKLGWRLAVVAVILSAIVSVGLPPSPRAAASGAVVVAGGPKRFIFGAAADAFEASSKLFARLARGARARAVGADVLTTSTTRAAASTTPTTSAAVASGTPGVSVKVRKAAGSAAAPPTAATASASSEEELRGEARKLRVKQLQSELTTLGVPYGDCVEKDDLVERLVQAKLRPEDFASAATETEVMPPADAAPAGSAGFGPDGVPSKADLEKAAEQFGGAAPAEAMRAAEKMMENPEAVRVLEEMQANPRMMQACMDIAMNGDAAQTKYAGDSEVMAYMEKLEKIMGPM